MAYNYRALDLTLVGANLEARINGNIIICTPHCAYAVATLSDDPWTEQSTPVDKLGGRKPTWNHTCRFFVPAGGASPARLYIRVLIRAKHMFGDQDVDIGESIIPLPELLLTDGIQTQPRPASYVIRTAEPEKLHGVLMISYKLHASAGVVEQAVAAAPAAAPAPVSSPWSTHAPFASIYRPPMASPYASRYNYGSYGYGCGTYYPRHNMSTLQQGRQMQDYADWDSFGMGLGMTGSNGAPSGAVLRRRYADYARIEEAYNDWNNNFVLGLGMPGSDGAPGAALGRRFTDRTRNMEDAYNAGYVAGSRNSWGWDIY